MLRRISNRQMEKIEDHLPTPKIKLILKEKGRKFHPVRRHSEGSAASSAKSSSKTNTWSEEDQEVSQYLTFEDHEAPQILRVSDWLVLFELSTPYNSNHSFHYIKYEVPAYIVFSSSTSPSLLFTLPILTPKILQRAFRFEGLKPTQA